jgi:hypothetical protein
MFGLFVLVGIVGTPNLDDLPFPVIPQVIKAEKAGQPVKSFASFTDERKDVVFVVITHIHLGVVTIRRLIWRHL